MTKPIRAVASSHLVRRKRAVIIAPIPMSGGKWVCVVIDGNMRFQTSAECDSEHDARQWAARTRALRNERMRLMDGMNPSNREGGGGGGFVDLPTAEEKYNA